MKNKYLSVREGVEIGSQFYALNEDVHIVGILRPMYDENPTSAEVDGRIVNIDTHTTVLLIKGKHNNKLYYFDSRRIVSIRHCEEVSD